MGLRETIDKHPRMTIGFVSGIAIISLSLSLLNTLGSGAASPLTKEFFTDDDGKSWFVDSVDRLPPFDHNGKQAVRVKLFTCDDRKTTFVGYLERYSDEMKRRLEASQAAVAAGKPTNLGRYSPEVLTSGTEVKRPGDPTWVTSGNMQARQKITNVLCPSGGVLDSVVP